MAETMTNDDIRELLAQFAVKTVETQTQINALAAEVRGLVVNVGAAPGAAPPVLALQSATQTVRKSSETTVMLCAQRLCPTWRPSWCDLRSIGQQFRRVVERRRSLVPGWLPSRRRGARHILIFIVRSGWFTHC